MGNEITLTVGPESIRSYKRLGYQRHYALAELIDNSVSSFLINREALAAVASPDEARPLTVRLAYDKVNQTLRVTDNAMGMELEELMSAMTIAKPPGANVGRHEYGMGLKTAACWFGNFWTVTTTKLGSAKEYTVTFDVEAVASGATNLPLTETEVGSESHYTIVEIGQMHQTITGRARTSTISNLQSMFRLDTREFLGLYWGEERLDYEEKIPFLKAADGTPYRREFEIHVAGSTVTGWIGVLEKGGRSIAGLAQVRKGRVVRGQPDAWKPAGIYGATEAANNLVSQRLIGEVHFPDEFPISHTKDRILFNHDDEEVLVDALGEEFREYVTKASTARKGDGGGPPKVAEATAVEKAGEVVESTGFEEIVDGLPIPDQGVTEKGKRHVVEKASENEPTRVWQIGQHRVKVYLQSDLSPQDPYYVADFAENDVICLVINKEHDFWKTHLHDVQDIYIYLLTCAFDAIAEFKCIKRGTDISPDTMRSIKDAFMRVTVSDD